jgi:gamma-glutamyltranspeptidase
MLEALNILEGFKLKEMGRNSAVSARDHRVAEVRSRIERACRRSEIRAEHPDAGAASKEYASVRRTQIDPNHAIAESPRPATRAA